MNQEPLNLPGPITRNRIVKGTTMTKTSISSMFFRRKGGPFSPILCIVSLVTLVETPVEPSRFLPVHWIQSTRPHSLSTNNCSPIVSRSSSHGMDCRQSPTEEYGQSQRQCQYGEWETEESHVADWIPLLSIKQISPICGSGH